METIPQLDEQAIRARVGSRNWQNGREYARDGAIILARTQGMTLKAACIGSQPEPYRVEVTFNDRGLASADCSCPVGEEGYCKHVAALLITWLQKPDTFATLEDVESALERRDKPALIALIKQMLRQQPDLELLLETPAPVDETRQTPVSPDIYRRQIATMFNNRQYEWGNDVRIGWNLREVVARGDAFLRHGAYQAATAAYAGIAAELIEQYETLDDEDGAISTVIGMCAIGLGTCLQGETAHAELREEIIEALFGIFKFDMEYGQLDLDEDIPDVLIRQTTDDEKRLLAGWVREHLPAKRDWGVDYYRQKFGAFLIELEGPTLSDAEYLRLCKEMGLTGQRVDRLLTVKRLDEAITAMEATSDHELLAIAELFVLHAEGDVAEAIVRERADQTRDLSHLRWLKNRAEESGDRQRTLDLAIRIYHGQPSLPAYQEVRDRARALGQWDAMRPEIMALLKQPTLRSLLIHVRLDEGEIDEAITLTLDALIAVRGSGMTISSYGYDMTLQVAKATEETRPRGALALYQHHAERLIDRRGRENYQQAATHLVTVRELYDRLDEFDRWEQYIAGLREKYRTLRALKEELNAAGL